MMKLKRKWGIGLLVCGIGLLLSSSPQARGQTRSMPVRVAYKALSGIGVLWLTHEQGIFRKHGLDSNLIYVRSGTTATQALLAGDIQFNHVSRAYNGGLGSRSRHGLLVRWSESGERNEVDGPFSSVWRRER